MTSGSKKLKNQQKDKQKPPPSPPPPPPVSDNALELRIPVTIPTLYDPLYDTLEEDVDQDIKMIKGMLADRPIIAKLYKNPEVGKALGNHIFKIVHPTILQYMGGVERDGTMYFLYENYSGSLQELYSQPKFRDIFNVRVKEIMRDILGGVEYLHSLNMCHGSIKSTNVAIILPRKLNEHAKIIVKLMGMNMGITNDDNGFLNDYKTVMPVLRQLMDPSCDEAIHLIRTIMDCEMFPVDLVAFAPSTLSIWKLIKEEPTAIFRHPFFWDEVRYMQYFTQLGDLLTMARQQCSASKVTYTSSTGLAHFIAELDHLPVYWGNQMPSVCQSKFGNDKFYMYTPDLLSELVRFIRDKHAHFADMDHQDQVDFGPPPGAYFRYFHRRFPEFFMTVYKAVEKHFHRYWGIVEFEYMKDFYFVEEFR